MRKEGKKVRWRENERNARGRGEKERVSDNFCSGNMCCVTNDLDYKPSSVL